MAGRSGKPQPAVGPKLRLDKWLWQARFCKTRAAAAALIVDGHVRVNRIRVTRPGRDVGPGDVLTFPHGTQIRVIRILALGQRRGPATEAQALFADLQPPPPGIAPPSPLE